MFDHVRIVMLCQEGLSSREVSRRLRMNQSDVVWRWGGTDLQELSMTCVAQAAQRLLLAVDDRCAWISARRNPESNVTMLNNAFCAATGRCDSTQTVQNRLHDAQLHSQRPWQDPHLTPRHRAAWYRWAQKHAEWTHQNWHQVLFTDKCRMCLQPDNHQRRVWRQSGQAERLRCTV